MLEVVKPRMPELQEDRTQIIVATVVALWALSLIATGARFLGRLIGNTSLWWDDWLILCATVIFVPAATADLLEAHWGAGKHIETVIHENPNNIVKFLKAIYAGEIFYPFIIVCIKCSILVLYYRLFGVRKGFAHVCFVLMGLTIAWGIATLLPAIFQCTPIDTAWDPTSTRSNCFNLRAYLVGTNVPNVLLDFSILITPLYPVWKLCLPTGKKIWLSGVFVLGACETAFSIIRLVALTSLDVSDVTWNYLPPIIWSTVEICVGTICACLPVMAPLIPKIFRGRSGLSGSSGFSSTNTPKVATHHPQQNPDQLEDDRVDLVLGRDGPMSIRQTIDIRINDDDEIALQTFT